MRQQVGVTHCGGMNDNLDVRRLSRTRHERVVAGVCGGIADYFSVDPNLVRIAVIVACFFGGAGFLLYAAGWVLMPKAGETTSIAQKVVSNYQTR